MSRRQRGASLLIPVLVLITAGAFAVIVAASQSGGDIHGTDAQADATEALFLAETGLERATRRFLAGALCSAAGLNENLASLASIGIASGRSITISAGADSDLDFNANPLPATQCRIQVTGLVAASNVSRTVQAIIDRNDNLAGAAPVAGFDNPAGAASPASWTGGSYDFTGGAAAGVNPNNCTRSAYAVRPRQGGPVVAASSIGTAPVSFTVTLPATVLVRFDYRIVRIGNSGNNACVSASGGGACPGAADLTGSPSGAAGDGEICFTLRDTTGATYDSTKATVDQSANIGLTVVGPACTPTTQQLPTNANYTPCPAIYNLNAGAAAPAFVRFTIAGAGTLTFDRIGFNLFIPTGGQAKEMWVDNIQVTPNATIGGIAAWRDCTVNTCPAV